MWRFRPHLRVGPFVWTPGPVRRRGRVPSMPWVTFRVVALFAIALAVLIWALNVA